MNLPSRTHRQNQQGFSMVLVLSLVALMSIMLITYSIITVNNARTAGSSASSSSGFYIAEAVMNARADRIRRQFKSFLTPSGASPSTTPAPCTNSNTGTGDLACENLTMNGHAARSYVTKSGTPITVTIPAGERFANLTAQETPFTVYGQALNSSGNPEAIANLVFRSRVVPLFQFAVFFDKDMEFDNTAQLSFTGPIHSNGNIFLDSGSNVSLSIAGQLTSAHDIYRRQKRSTTCQGTVNLAMNTGAMKSLACNGGTALTNTFLKAQYGGTVESQIGELEVPSISALQPSQNAEYWQKADLRVVLKRRGGLTGTTWEAQLVKSDGTQLPIPLSTACNYNTAASGSYTFRDNREAQYWESATGGNQPARATKRLLEIDVRELLTCIQKSTTLGIAGGLQNSSDGGLVIFLTVDDAASDTVTGGLLNGVLGDGSNGAISQTSPARPNNYGVRLRNGASLLANDGSRPLGVTFVTDQAAYIAGDFNNASASSSNWVPTAILADSMNILSKTFNTNALTTCQDRSGFWISSNRWVRVGSTSTVINLTTTTPLASQVTAGLNPIYSSVVNLGANNEVTYYGYTDANLTAAGINATSNRTVLAALPASQTPLGNGDARSHMNLSCRFVAATTTVNAAILAGTATTGDEGATYDSIAKQSGGVHNMMRFQEDWGANGGNPNGTQTYSYRGSLVSLDKPQHAAGDFVLGNPIYNPPLRNWAFETNFRDSANLPPLTPRFVYIKQDNFVRNFSQQ